MLDDGETIVDAGNLAIENKRWQFEERPAP